MRTRHRISPGICQPIFRALKRKAVHLTAKERVCALLLQEIELEPHINYLERDDFVIGFEDFGWDEGYEKVADSASVFMLRSVYGTWKQPVAFVFLDWPPDNCVVARLLTDVTRETKAAGLNLMAYVCNHADHHVGAIDLLLEETRVQVEMGAEVETGMLLVEDQAIVPIFDPCMLLTDIRGNFCEGAVVFEKDGVEKVAKWEHVLQAYEIDKELTQHLSKLTDRHVYPMRINKASVTDTIQVFSSTFSDYMKTIAGKTSNKTTESLPIEALETAELIAFLDWIFDSVNGSSQEATGKPLRGLVTENSPHSQVWQEGKEMFSKMKMLEEDPDFAVTCFLKWPQTLEGFELIKKRLAKMGYNSFSPRSFHVDPLENCFDLMREWLHKKKTKYPYLTCTRFSTFYNLAFTSKDVSGCHASQSNCEADGLSFLVTIHDFIQRRNSC